MMVDIIAFKAKQLKKGSIADMFPKMVQDQNIPVLFNHEIRVSLISQQIVVNKTNHLTAECEEK